MLAPEGFNPDRLLGFLAGEGEMARRIREFDWGATPLGPPAQWPGPLRTALRLMLGTRHPVFVFWGPEHLCFYNDAYSVSLGPEKHPSILGRRGREAWDEIWPIIGPQIELVMDGRGATWHEDHLVPITRHGALQEVYWTYSYSPIDDAQAESGVGGVLVLTNETTAQVLRRRALHHEQQRWRTLFDQAPGFACVLEGAEHRFRYANAGYLALIGRSGQDILGRRVGEVLPEVAEQGFIALLDSVRLSGQAHQGNDAEFTLVDPAGGPVHVHRLDFVYQPIRDDMGAVSGVFVLGHDITERERVRSERNATLQRLQAATDAAELGVYHWHIEQDRIDWDARLRALWRAAPDAPIGYRTFLDGVHPDDRDSVQRAVNRALDPAGDGRYEAQFRVLRGDAPPRWVRATGHTSFENGRPRALVGAVQDITRDRELLVRLAESDRLKDDFLAMLSHELRNPLSAIRNAGVVLGDPRLDDGRARGARDVILRQCAHMAVLLDDLFDAARITRGKLHLQAHAVALREVLQQAIDAVRPALEARGQRLHLTLPPSQWTVHADPVRLAQVFGNLLGNAAKYGRPDGEVFLRARRGAAADEVQVVVADDGLGIAPESLEAIFELFTQVHRDANQAQGGLGIGLALVRGLVLQHGGRVEARSEGLGRGAEFVVSLPMFVDAAVEATPHAESPAPAPAAPPSGLDVLLVDDNRDAAQMLAALLELDGHRVHLAHDGPAGLALALECRPDVALLDIGLPGMDGHELARRLRQEPWAATLRLAALTGWGQETDHKRSRDAGFDIHLVKPVDLAQLQAVLAPPAC